MRGSEAKMQSRWGLQSVDVPAPRTHELIQCVDTNRFAVSQRLFCCPSLSSLVGHFPAATRRPRRSKCDNGAVWRSQQLQFRQVARQRCPKLVSCCHCSRSRILESRHSQMQQARPRSRREGA